MFTNKGGILCDIFVCCPGVSHAVKTQPGFPTSVADLGSSASTGQRSMFAFQDPKVSDVLKRKRDIFSSKPCLGGTGNPRGFLGS